MSAKKVKALILLSGGLDSMLAAKILIEQGVEVTGLTFKSYFFSTQKGKAAAKQLGIPHRVVDFSSQHLEIVKNPPHGYGKAANPCLDCHLLMFKMARRIMEGIKDTSHKNTCEVAGWSETEAMTPRRWMEKKSVDEKNFDFVATGEVLGERPFSQNKKALGIIAEESGLGDRLLRPLSAQLLPITLPEKKGWVDRKKLLAIQGRRRQTQMSLAKKYRLSYPQPAGGCILCEKDFAKKLFNLFEKWPDCSGDDIGLLFLGRHFWHRETPPARCPELVKGLLGGGVRYIKIVLGKNQEENEKLGKIVKKDDIIIKPANFPGPTALIRGVKITQATTRKAKSFILSYSPKAPKNPKFVIK